MSDTGEVHHLLGLSGIAATRDEPARILEESLRVLLELAGADAAVVVQQSGEGVALSHAAGTTLEASPIETAELARGALLPTRVPEAWEQAGVTAVSAQLLPGHLGVLALAWTDEPHEGVELDVAASVLESGLARTEAVAELNDLADRIDHAQHLAHMGDYDWHIPSDTNQWSDELFRIYGHEPQSFNASYERFLSLLHPEDRERISGVHQRAYATGEPYQMMERIVRPDGEVRYLESSGEVVMDDQGVPVRMRGTCIDVTERVLAERESEHLDARYAALVETAPDAILVVDASGHVIDANPKAHALLEGDPARRWMGDLGHLESDGQGVEVTTLAGSRLLVDVTRAVMSPVEPDGGLVAVFLRDSTERLAGEELAAHRSQAQLRRRQALEINDNVVQGLVAAAYALDAEQYPVVGTYVDRTLSAARSMMDELL
ncbi:MAG: PAS domain-containing protein, partial [Marmoricola sp.]|nr:PAS domain-containing protein [Marmoricola sp.]